MNDIIKPLTVDGNVGWDKYGQLWHWKYEGPSRVGHPIADVRNKVCPVCRRGWDLTAESFEDQFYWSGREEFAHLSCYIRFRALAQFEFWSNALVEVGFIFGRGDHEPGLEEIPNEYWRPTDPWGAGSPWYRVHLLKKDEERNNVPFGRTLKLGFRKHVYALLIEPGFAPCDLEFAKRLFEKESVTKSFEDDRVMIHAHGRDKAKEYLGRFAEILGVASRRPATKEPAASA